MLERNSIDKVVKDTDQLKRIGLMNNYNQLVEEILIKEIINI